MVAACKNGGVSNSGPLGVGAMHGRNAQGIGTLHACIGPPACKEMAWQPAPLPVPTPVVKKITEIDTSRIARYQHPQKASRAE